MWPYTHWVRDPERISPDTRTLDQARLDRPGNPEIQPALFCYDDRTDPERFGERQPYVREHRPLLLAVWGTNDQIFGPEGAQAFAGDLPDAEVHLLDTGHLALVEEGVAIADLVRTFLAAQANADEGDRGRGARP